MEPKELLQALMDREGVNPTSLAQKIGNAKKMQPFVWRFLKGHVKNPRPESLQPLADHYNIDVEALRSPKAAAAAAKRLQLVRDNPPPPRGSSGSDKETPANAVEARVGTTRVPVISYIQAGDLTSIMDDHAPGAAGEYLLTDLPVSRHTFALEIKGTSMLPEFREGDKVIIDPGVAPAPGDFVAAKQVDVHGHGEATFKKYRPRGINAQGQEVFELTPLNDDFPTMRSDTTPLEIIGTMVEHRRFRRPPL